MCRFYGRGFDRYYRIWYACYKNSRRRGAHVPWPEPRPDIRNAKGHVAWRKLKWRKQFRMFPAGRV
jgi:hypothetical protein